MGKETAFDFDSSEELSTHVITMWVDANLHLKGLTHPKGVSVGTSKRISEALERVMEKMEPYEKARNGYHSGYLSTLGEARLTLERQVKEWERINKLPWWKKTLVLLKGEDEYGVDLEHHPKAYSDEVEQGICGKYWGWKEPFSWNKKIMFGDLPLFKIGIVKFNKKFLLNLSLNRIELFVWRFHLMVRIGFWGVM